MIGVISITCSSLTPPMRDGAEAQDVSNIAVIIPATNDVHVSI
jgi:hypothetical protein